MLDNLYKTAYSSRMYYDRLLSNFIAFFTKKRKFFTDKNRQKR